MKSYTPSRSPCPIGRASRVLGDRWAILIVREAFLGAERFEHFMDRLTVSRASLTSRLTMLVEAGVLQREPPTGKRALYRLTEAGRALEPVFGAMALWSGEHLFPEGQPPKSWDQA
ncbi:winged helix-turn-helix transcriptional regulator [Parerythrobacter jejuensis]|uniref:Transcriptional regulator n=1 Tax=Parerythrobacter jejuensis TaxID=795812 RepID=A0A845AX83_9SPHN|nr:helix-turn-helix domain-containing protein [Parerythrobacter jejuensis]MXP31045.1 transcriptional regulator [Parerythrobacter jejuensis]MXP33805.1 transcriptional regulator [Parerythrobacter jejuensis]